jgi:hypothetical protein
VGREFYDWRKAKGNVAHYWIELASKDFWAIYVQDLRFYDKASRPDQPILTLIDSNTDGVLMTHELITQLGLNKSYDCDKLHSA